MTFEYSSGARSIADELLYRERQLSGSTASFPRPFINIKFHGSPFANGGGGKL